MNSNTSPAELIPPYLLAFRGSLLGLRRWDDLDLFWQVLKNNPDKHWYAYAIGEPVPTSVLTAKQLEHFVHEIDALLRREHEEEYCGIVYVDDPADPHFVKIYDPNNLGVVCGFSENPPLPGWTLSTCAPVEITQHTFVPQNRKRWWQRLFSKP